VNLHNGKKGGLTLEFTVVILVKLSEGLFLLHKGNAACCIFSSSSSSLQTLLRNALSFFFAKNKRGYCPNK
jgi:hypothetical protein